MAIYKDAAQPIALRMDAAKAAIAYEKPRLAAIDGAIEGTITLEQLVMASFEPRANKHLQHYRQKLIHDRLSPRIQRARWRKR